MKCLNNMESVPFKPEHQHAVERLIEGTPFKGVIWQWQFQCFDPEQSFNPVVIENQGQLVGFNGVMPTRVRYLGQQMNALWSCDFYVDETYRGQGVGRFIKQELVKKNPLIMTFGVSYQASLVLHRMGWVRCHEVSNFRYSRQLTEPRDLVLRLLQWGNRLRGLFRRTDAWKGRLEWRSQLPPEEQVNALWQSVESHYRKVVCRDYRYLHWRYECHPLAAYCFLTARDASDGPLRAVLVVREHQGIVRLVDWLGPLWDRPLALAMVRECLRHYDSARLFTATTTPSGLASAFSHSGFFRARTRPSFFVYSSLCEDKDPEQDWFLMAGDSDGEMLLAARENLTPEQWEGSLDNREHSQ